MGLLIKATETEIVMPGGQTFYERKFKKQNGLFSCAVIVLMLIIALVFGFRFFISGITTPSIVKIWYALCAMTAALVCVIIACRGLKIIKPNEAAVFTLFGAYYVTVMQPGFYFVNPFATEEGVRRRFGAGSIGGLVGSFKGGYGSSGERIPLSPIVFELALDNILNTQKGYVLSMGTIIEYRIANPTKALFGVDNFGQYLYEICECTLRDIIHNRIFYGDTEKDKIDAAVLQLAKEISEGTKELMENELSEIGIEILSVSVKEIYDKREQRYFSVNLG